MSSGGGGSPAPAPVVTYPVYESRPTGRTITQYGHTVVPIYRQDPQYVDDLTKPIYRSVPVYQPTIINVREDYQVYDPESYDYIPIPNANTYFAANDYVRYTAGGNPVSGLVDGRIYAVHSSNTTAVKLRDWTISGTANTEALVWTKLPGVTASHTLTLLSGAAVTGANSFITLSSANSYFSVGDVVTYSTIGTGLTNQAAANNVLLANNLNMYVQSVNSTGLALSLTSGGSRLPLTRGTSGESIVLTGYNRLSGTIASASASQFTAGDTVVYRVQSSNTSLKEIQHLRTYYVQFANSTHIAIARESGGQRIPLTKGLTESGHSLVSTKAGNGVIAVTSANNKFNVNDSVIYTVAAGNTALSGLTSGGEYFVQFANATHLALSKQAGGPRIELYQGVTESGHTLTGGNYIRANNDLNTGDLVQYYPPSGYTVSANLTANSIYSVKTSNSTTFALQSVSELSTITIDAAGSGYTNDDIIIVDDKTPTVPAMIRLSTDGSGGITGYSFINKGIGYTATPTISLDKLTGTGGSLTAANTVGNVQVVFPRGTSEVDHRFIRSGITYNTITPIDTRGLVSNAAVLYYTNQDVTAITGLTNNTTYFVDYVSNTALALKSTAGGVRIPLTRGLSTNGHNIILTDANNTIRTSSASNFANGDLVLYRTSSGNTVLDPLKSGKQYYIQFANATHIALSETSSSPRIPLIKGKFESGHTLYKTSGNSAVIASSYAANLAVNDIVKYVVNSGSTSVGGLTGNGSYYIQFANATHIALSDNEDGVRLLLTDGSNDTGHRLIASGQKSTIISEAASGFTRGDRVKYVTDAGNTAIAGFSNGSTYYVQFANATNIAFSLTRDGDRIDLDKGSTEGGHYFSPTQSTKSTIQGAHNFNAGDIIGYAFTSNSTPLIGVSNTTTYYVEMANATHFAISTTSGGPRVALTKGATEAGHTFFSLGTNSTISSATSASDFANGDQVRYFTPTGGGTVAPGLVNNGIYYIQFANATHIALAPTLGGFRVPLTKGITESDHKIVKIGPNSLIETPFASRLSVGEPIVYTSGTPLATKGPNGYLTSGTTYYVEFANATHFAIATTQGGERITLVKQTTPGSVHTVTDSVINSVTISVASTNSTVSFTPGGSVENITTSTTRTIANVSISL